MATRGNYWSCSKFAGWVRRQFGSAPKLESGTMDEWNAWKRTSKQDHPIVYWFTEKFLNKLQDFFLKPYDLYDDFRCYCRNRFITKTHYAPTKLKPGQWHETDTRILHANFELLVDFIEIEKAGLSLWCHSDKPRPWWRRFRFTTWGNFRSRDLGIEYLTWEMSLTYNDDWLKDDPQYGLPTGQAESAKEQFALYTWWKDVRPNRPDPYEASGYNAYFEIKRKWAEAHGEDEFWSFLSDNQPEDHQSMQKVASEKCHQLEQQYDEEDTEMLIRLIKLRHHLWT